MQHDAVDNLYEKTSLLTSNMFHERSALIKNRCATIQNCVGGNSEQFLDGRKNNLKIARGEEPTHIPTVTAPRPIGISAHSEGS